MLLLLLGLVLGGQGAAAFVVQLWGSCALAPNGSVPSFTLGFNGAPLVCSEPGSSGQAVSCTVGMLQNLAEYVAQGLSMDPAWRKRMEQREQACRRLLPHSISGLGSAPPQVLITSSSSGDPLVPLLLTCHVWGFYPPDVTVLWLHNGDLVTPDEDPPPIVPNGDLTYQTQLRLLAAPAHGDTFTCSVQHPSLDQPLLVDWGHGLSPVLLVKVVAATMVMLLGIGVFAIGLHRYRAPAPALGYTPLDGDTYPTGSI
ncbi:HLA class II histocompatibility antigen, DM beta chain-like [Melopsittacus undulatus]|uniref:HLA class II histocompatibility antigen, DM beta chain-like n=1 Tax=Melopsittacus undulatus TaxID=13146 RepID=UPI00146E0D2D|nr:HLA class II histocompatibility antigen, DM beta chain-like [Melopsittacus undulatus]